MCKFIHQGSNNITCYSEKSVTKSAQAKLNINKKIYQLSYDSKYSCQLCVMETEMKIVITEAGTVWSIFGPGYLQG